MGYTSRITTSLIALFSASPLLSQTALAQSFTVLSGETRTATQTMATDGDVGIVEAGGEIGTTGNLADGIASTGNGAQIIQSGTIGTTGNGAIGILSTGDAARISLSGAIGTTGDDAYGIFSLEPDLKVVE